jgi:hypothetical protein
MKQNRLNRAWQGGLSEFPQSRGIATRGEVLTPNFGRLPQRGEARFVLGLNAAAPGAVGHAAPRWHSDIGRISPLSEVYRRGRNACRLISNSCLRRGIGIDPLDATRQCCRLGRA